jgi:hypothetical protein
MSEDDRVKRIRQLQAWLLSDVYPAGENRRTVSAELMKLRNTRKPKKAKGREDE